MNRTDPDFPSILRTDDDSRGLEAYLDEQRQRREAAAQPAIGAGVAWVLAMLGAAVIVLGIVFVLEVLP